MFINNELVTEEIKGEIKFLETNDNENTTSQNIWDTAKVVLRGKFIAIQSYLKEQEKCQIDNLTLHLKQTGKRRRKKKPQNYQKERNKKDWSRNKWKRNETIVKIYKTKRWFFEKINKIPKPLARLIKEKKERRIKSTKLEIKKRGYNRQCRNMKDYKRLLWTTIWQ